ncbi:MAG: High-affinity Na(+)/H(+) antiporter NhaS3 [Chloroflexi bacterium ADurb.Bin325]|nr:MAG: High-affinity Na(+)/H(+) antiporter NhaS3 [Chloroflexi bacterium ADurb.Bin325]
MAPVLQLLLELTILITAAKLAGYLSTRFNQPAVLGEILAGLILGPSLIDLQSAAFFSSPHLGETIAELAEIGVIFLMFLAGLEVDLEQMRKAGRVVILAGLMGVAVPLVLGMLTMLPFGFDLTAALGLGMILTATSVSISAQTLLELDVLRSREGIALLGAAVVDDVAAIILLSVFIALATGGGGGVGAILILLARVVGFAVIFGLAGWLFVPRALDYIGRLPISQGIVATAVVLGLFYAWAAEVLGGIAMITGSFMAGLFAARSRVHHRVVEGFSVLTYAFFVPIFFVNIGLHANIWELQGPLVLATVAVTLVAIVAKVLGSGAGALLGGFSRGESFRLGLGMISRGEVGLIVAQLLVANAIVSADVMTLAVIMVLVTTLVTPPFLRMAFARKGAAARPTATGSAG